MEINVKQEFQKALALFREGKIKEAEKLSVYVTEQMPNFQIAWKVLGAIYLQSNRTSESLRAFQQSVQLNPKDPEAHNNLGATLEAFGKLPDAEVSYRQAIALKPDYAEAYFNLAVTLQKMGKLEKAETNYRKTISLKSEFAEAYNNLGVLLEQLNKLEDSQISIEKAIKLKPQNAQFYNNLGATLEAFGKLPDAEVSYRQAIALKPDYAEAYFNLAVTLQKMGKLEKAETNYRKTISLKSEFAEAYNNLGVLLEQLNKLEDSQISIKQAIKLKPKDARYHNNLGVTLQKMGIYEKAVICFNHAIRIKPDYAEAYNNKGYNLENLGRLNEAESNLRHAIALKPNYADAFFNLASTSKSIQDARNLMDKCLNIDSKHERAKLMKVALNFYLGDRNDFESLMKTKFKKHSYMRSFSWVFSLSHLPDLYFNRWDFFDSIIRKSITSRPFYEFGVWRASSFNYLIKAFKKGYGFDTFTGLPENWNLKSHIEKSGSYSSNGVIPKIKGGQFIVGKFEDTLKNFFSKKRPLASVINFDADLYTSTICALNFSKQIIDKNTILIFDELIMHESWENDEFKALNEFCSSNNLTYNVMAISFFSKQVAIKLV